jgi:superfamily II DNA or RNA helicase
MGRGYSEANRRGRTRICTIFFHPSHHIDIIEQPLQKLKLLIIDEVHLLNEERGAVIETIVARTLRQVSGRWISSMTELQHEQVESSQSVIRIVGLSATLPNYIDVADFLRSVTFKGNIRRGLTWIYLVSLDTPVCFISTPPSDRFH